MTLTRIHQLETQLIETQNSHIEYLKKSLDLARRLTFQIIKTNAFYWMEQTGDRQPLFLLEDIEKELKVASEDKKALLYELAKGVGEAVAVARVRE